MHTHALLSRTVKSEYMSIFLQVIAERWQSDPDICACRAPLESRNIDYVDGDVMLQGLAVWPVSTRVGVWEGVPEGRARARGCKHQLLGTDCNHCHV